MDRAGDTTEREQIVARREGATAALRMVAAIERLQHGYYSTGKYLQPFREGEMSHADAKKELADAMAAVRDLLKESN